MQGAKDALLKELESLPERESLLTDSYSSQVLRKDLYELKMREIENKRVELNKQLADLEAKGGIPADTFERIKNVFLDGNKASKQYLEVKDPERRRMLEKLLSNASIKNQNIAEYQYKSPYQVLAMTPKNIDLEGMLTGLS